VVCIKNKWKMSIGIIQASNCSDFAKKVAVVMGTDVPRQDILQVEY
jgi:hypothetical protein